MFTYKEQAKAKGTPYQRAQEQLSQTGRPDIALHRHIRDQANQSSFDLGVDRNDFSRTRDDQQAAFKPKYDDFKQVDPSLHRQRKQADSRPNQELGLQFGAKFDATSTGRADFADPRSRTSSSSHGSGVESGGKPTVGTGARQPPPKSQFTIGQSNERHLQSSQRTHFPQHTDMKQPVGAGRKPAQPSFNLINGESRDDKKSSYEGYTEGQSYNVITGQVEKKRETRPQRTAPVDTAATPLNTLAALRPPSAELPPMVPKGLLKDP